MKKKAIIERISEVTAEIDKIIVDLPEVTITVDQDYQATRLKVQNDKLKDLVTEIHGGGTGRT